MWISRVVWVIYFIASLIFASFYGGRVSYTLFYLSLLFVLVLLVYLFFVVRSFKYYQTFGKKSLVKGEPTPYELRIKNETKLSFSALKVNFIDKKSHLIGEYEKAWFCLLPGEEKRITSVLVPKIRGEYLAGAQSFEIMDPFGLFRFRYKVLSKALITVLPRIIDCPYPYLIIPDEDNKQQLETVHMPVERDICVRDYAPGDPLKQVHWKVSAKSRKLMVHRQIDRTKRGITVWMDMTPVICDEQQKGEPAVWIEDAMLEHLIAIAGCCLKERLSCHISMDYKHFQHYCVADKKAFDNLYQESALMTFLSKQPLEEQMEHMMQEKKQATDFILLTHSLEDAFALQITQLCEKGRRVSLIYFSEKEELDQRQQDYFLFLQNRGITVLHSSAAERKTN